MNPTPKTKASKSHMGELSELYDKLFKMSYNQKNNGYNALTLEFARKIEGKILDAGCGRGHASRMLIEAGYDVFAIEFSSVCCKEFLDDIPHECTDIVTHCKKNRYGGVVCMGVLEHIPYEGIDETIEAISKAADSALFAIANHSDVQCGAELHIIKEVEGWWREKLLQYYGRCKVISRYRGRLFTFECNEPFLPRED